MSNNHSPLYYNPPTYIIGIAFYALRRQLEEKKVTSFSFHLIVAKTLQPLKIFFKLKIKL